MPLVELAYRKSSKPITYSVVMQFQFVLSLFATLVSIIWMAINKDFQVIPREGRNFGLGQVKYYLLLIAVAVAWQIASAGFLGIIYCTSSLFSGIFTTCLLPFTQVAASIAFHEEFTGQKGMSHALCLWGFLSYFVGEYKKTKTAHPIAYDKEKSELTDYNDTTEGGKQYNATQ
ncbi:purine permease 3-like [Papaver somniferum]|uniref:purine permease 3-like n=1 Tax=Papaver somniferum TaxID=3469 RepID=UPI000E6F47D7|nr:purine permease 3-like [Papaver somniferum]